MQVRVSAKGLKLETPPTTNLASERKSEDSIFLKKNLTSRYRYSIIITCLVEGISEFRFGDSRNPKRLDIFS
jgi:hypothetical protein